MPPLDLIVSATAPLAQDLAREVEAKFRTTLLEIYGSTETGQIALRRTAETAVWRLWPDVRLKVSNDQVFAHGGHVEQLTADAGCHRDHRRRRILAARPAAPTWSMSPASAARSAI